jgi:hypothetical protein
MISIKVKKITVPESLRGLDKTVKHLINNAVFADIDLHRAVHSVRTNYLYKELKKNTGKLGESMTPEKRKLNQYASVFGFYFDPRIAPHAATQISEGAGIKTIKAPTGKKLAIPVGPAKRVRSRLSPRDFGGSSDANSVFAVKKNVLFKKHAGIRGVPYFILKNQIQVPQRVYSENLRIEFGKELTPQINRIAVKALRELKL